MNRIDPPSTLFNASATAFVVVWIALGFVAFVAFFLGKDANLKRTWYPRFMIASGIFFAVASSALMALRGRTFWGLGILIVVGPVTALIVFLNHKMTKFCDACGAMQFSSVPFAPLRFCSKCGASLQAKPKTRNDLFG